VSGELLLRPGQPLTGDFDPEERAREIPPSFVLKGMFFTRLVERAGASWEAIQPTLERPPRGGRYVAFSNYPQSDYERLSASVARKLHRQVGLREAIRRLARDDFDVLASSTMGRVLLSVVGDARAALLKIPYVYSKVAPGDWTVGAQELDETTVRVEFIPNYGSWEYQVGQLEGIVQAFDRAPALRVALLPQRHLRIDVTYA
jgi:uncharacterized protein (TIGR02265 family)